MLAGVLTAPGGPGTRRKRKWGNRHRRGRKLEFPDPLTPAEIRDKLLLVDGEGSGVDATFDGLSSTQLLRSDEYGTERDADSNGSGINGNVGIGAATPQTTDVNGAIRIGSEEQCGATVQSATPIMCLSFATALNGMKFSPRWRTTWL